MKNKVYKGQSIEKEMRCIVFGAFLLSVSVFLLGFVMAAGESGSETIFTIAGCTAPTGEGIPAGNCSSDGEYYCDDASLTIWKTRTDLDGAAVPTACSYGEGTYTSGEAFCCPSNYYCDSTDLVCLPRTTNCVDYDNEGDCENNVCFWVDDSCVDSPKEYGCSVYSSSDDCEEDVLNLGQEGEGSEVCGDYVNAGGTIDYVIPAESCRCEWSNGKCNFTYEVYPEVFGEDPDYFKCNKYFNVGDCTNYQRLVSWDASTSDLSGIFSSPAGVPSAVLTATGCTSGQETKSCGKALLELPGFSLFAFVCSLASIFAIYYFKRN